MAKYIISYDLKTYSDDRSQDYEKLYSTLKRNFQRCVKLTESCYIIDTFYSIDAVYKEVSSILNYKDSIFVGVISNPARFKNCIDNDVSIYNVLR